MKHDVSKKVIVITGGSDGIGLETTKALLDAKKVIVASRSHEKIADLLL
jgi:NAD(P)-dependent dehydrogenase (short-subunit alcohol dehydrogenase family)